MIFSQKLRAAGTAILRAIPKISLIIGAISICTMVAFVTIAVIVRYTTGNSLHFAIEYTEYLVPVIVMWGAAYTLREKSHINVDMVVTHFPKKTREWMEVIGFILGLVYIIILIKYQFDLASYNIRIGSTSDYPTKTLIGWVQMALPLGLCLLVFQLIVEIVIKIRHLIWGHPETSAASFDTKVVNI